MATDYDVWHPQHDDVTVEVVIRTLNANVQKARETVEALIPTIAATRTCTCGDALQSAIMTAPEGVLAEVREKLRPLIGRYME
jgi:5'-methylthioadenosine phosphorylase